nr:lectin domain containing protein [uncultured Mediterranean phage uvMED]
MATSIKRSKGSQSSLRIGTYSYWIKIATPHSTSGGFQVYTNTVANDNNRGYWQYTSDGKWRMVDNDDGGTHIQLRTNRLFRDVNAWYHFVVRIDTTQATSTDRVRLYVNGVQETSFDQTDYPAQNTDLKIFEGGQTDREYMNRIYGGSPQSANWYVSHFHYCDGQSYAPTVFGSQDATTGEWKINTSPSVTYGNQGWFMFKDDASLNDDSGNSNNWSSDSGTIQKSEDNPNNVFATWNPLTKLHNGTYTFTNGNTTCEVNVRRGTHSTLGASSGKFYWETKLISNNNTNNNATGISAKHSTAGNDGTGEAAEEYIYKSDGQKTSNNTSSSYASTYTNGDIIGVAMDLDNNKLYFSKNGTWQNSGVPTSGSTGTGAISIIAPASTTDNFYVANAGNENDTAKWSANFGNGYFGTTAVSSAGTNASGNGIFEYDVPTGYTALSTKGLNL